MKQKSIITISVLLMVYFYTCKMLAETTVNKMFSKSTTHIVSLNYNDFYLKKSSEFNWSIHLGEYGTFQLSIKPTQLFSEAYINRNAANNGDKLPLIYKGTIKGKPDTKVALTINANFLSGFIDTGNEVIFFEPYKTFNVSAKKDELIIYYQKDVIDKGHTCISNNTNQQARQIEVKNHSLKSAAANSYTVEMVLVADYGMFEKHSGNTLNYIISVLNNVKSYYDDEFNDPINFTVVDDYIATIPEMNLWSNTTYATDLLAEFSNTNYTNVVHDLASLWVTRDIWDYDEYGNQTYDVAGIAYESSICGNKHNLIEYKATNASKMNKILAHEIGHNFGAEHDPDNSSTIMSPSAAGNTWSDFSKKKINEFYPNATCLLASGEVTDLNFSFCGTSTLNENILTVIDAQVQNAGTTSTGAVKVGWYLSSDDNITTSDYLAATQSTYELVSGSQTNFAFTVNIGVIPPGNYYLGCIIDYENSLAEFSEDNNIDCVSPSASFTVTAPKPDLQISDCGFFNNRSFFGVQVKNVGGLFSDATTLDVYLSATTTINTNSYKVGTANIPVLNGATSTLSDINFNTGTNHVPPGDYYVGLIIDADNTVTESNENNNTGCISPSPSVTITSEKINITAPAGNDIYSPGDAISIKWTDNITENVIIKMEALTGTTIHLTNSAESNGSYLYTIPSNITTGQYRIFIQSKGDRFVNHYTDYFIINKIGDVDMSGKVIILDAYIVSRLAVGLLEIGDDCKALAENEICEALADMNGNGEVDILDAYQIARCAVGLDGCD